MNVRSASTLPCVSGTWQLTCRSSSPRAVCGDENRSSDIIRQFTVHLYKNSRDMLNADERYVDTYSREPR